MKNDITVGAESRAHSDIDIDDGSEAPLPPILSIDSAWAEVPPTRSAGSCGYAVIHAYNVPAGLHRRYPIPSCDTWWHQPCAEKKAAEVLRDIHHMIQKGASVGGETWVGVCETSDLFGTNRMGDRRYTAERRLNRPVRFVTIHRKERPDASGGVAITLATAPLGGRDAPKEFVPAPDPISIAAAALTLPGVARVNHSQQHRPEDEHEDTGNIWLGVAGDAFYRAVEERTAELVEERHGEVVNARLGATADGRITNDEYAECLVAAWAEMRAKSQRRST